MSPTAQIASTQQQIRLQARPSGLPKASDWQCTTEAVQMPAAGGVLVKTLALSLDPAMRGWMNEGKSYIPPVGLGEVMRAGGVGVVVASENADFPVGAHVTGAPGVQEYWLVPADQVKRSGMARIDLRLGSLTQWLNVLGMPGMTGYFGLMDVGQPKAGETLVVSGAAGAVGQTVGQVAKIKGCRVVGIAGGAAKCEWVVKELGFDAYGLHAIRPLGIRPCVARVRDCRPAFSRIIDGGADGQSSGGHEFADILFPAEFHVDWRGKWRAIPDRYHSG